MGALHVSLSFEILAQWETEMELEVITRNSCPGLVSPGPILGGKAMQVRQGETLFSF